MELWLSGFCAFIFTSFCWVAEWDKPTIKKLKNKDLWFALSWAVWTIIFWVAFAH